MLARAGIPKNVSVTHYAQYSSNNTYIKFQTDSLDSIIEQDKQVYQNNLYKSVVINEEMVDMFNRFLKETYPSSFDRYILNFDSLNYSDIESLRIAWYNYLYGFDNTSVSDTVQPVSKIDSTSAQEADNETQKDTTIPEELSTTQSLKIQNSDLIKARIEAPNPQEIQNLEEKVYEAVAKVVNKELSPLETVNEEFEFQVQIAASHKPISDNVMNGIYSGPEKINQIYEDGWYKYSIGTFQIYKTARTFRDSSQIPGAFVVAFLNGKKINIADALLTRTNTGNYSAYTKGNNILFKVQIAACRIEIPDAELKSIYNGTEKIEMSFEDGWYKYAINCGGNYKIAWQKAIETGVPGVFVTAYQNGKRINLKDLIGNK